MNKNKVWQQGVVADVMESGEMKCYLVADCPANADMEENSLPCDDLECEDYTPNSMEELFGSEEDMDSLFANDEEEEEPTFDELFPDEEEELSEPSNYCPTMNDVPWGEVVMTSNEAMEFPPVPSWNMAKVLCVLRYVKNSTAKYLGDAVLYRGQNVNFYGVLNEAIEKTATQFHTTPAKIEKLMTKSLHISFKNLNKLMGIWLVEKNTIEIMTILLNSDIPHKKCQNTKAVLKFFLS